MTPDISCRLVPRDNRFYCTHCDTDWDDLGGGFYDGRCLCSCCPYCGKLCMKEPCCGLCHQPIGKKSKGIKCGYCGAKFLENPLYPMLTVRGSQ